PAGHIENGVDLAAWAKARMREWRRGTLAADRVAALQSLGLTAENTDETWIRGLAVARKYHQSAGDLRPPRTFTAGEVNLSRWLDARRSEHRRGRLAGDRVAALDALGIEWDPRGAARARGLQAAGDYQREHGHLHVAARYVTDDGYALGAWIVEQRKRRKSLPAEQIAVLDALGIKWAPRT
ncbi:MAG: helicase associated domain-containing protein, partial [Actinomycetes bacterium]